MFLSNCWIKAKVSFNFFTLNIFAGKKKKEMENKSTVFSGEKNAPTGVLESERESSLATDFRAGTMLMSPDTSFHRIWDNLQNCCCGWFLNGLRVNYPGTRKILSFPRWDPLRPSTSFQGSRRVGRCHFFLSILTSLHVISVQFLSWVSPRSQQSRTFPDR